MILFTPDPGPIGSELQQNCKISEFDRTVLKKIMKGSSNQGAHDDFYSKFLAQILFLVQQFKVENWSYSPQITSWSSQSYVPKKKIDFNQETYEHFCKILATHINKNFAHNLIFSWSAQINEFQVHCNHIIKMLGGSDDFSFQHLNEIVGDAMKPVKLKKLSTVTHPDVVSKIRITFGDKMQIDILTDRGCSLVLIGENKYSE